MLNPQNVESKNLLTINGTLSEIDIQEGKTNDGREYVRGRATIRVDQEINGEIVENDIPVQMFSMRKKTDQTPNPNYDRIIKYRTQLVPMSIVEDPEQATRVYVGGNAASIGENLFVGKDGNVVSTFQINSNFINKAKKADEPDCATFEFTGVIGKIKEEFDKKGEETGRLIVSLIVFGYNGIANVIDLIAEDVAGSAAKTFIESHWEEGDTVSVAGIIKMSFKTLEWEEEQGFGAPIKRHKTISSRELLIKQGSGEGLEESLSYDPELVNVALQKREEYKQELINKGQSTTTTSKTGKKKPLGF